VASFVTAPSSVQPRSSKLAEPVTGQISRQLKVTNAWLASGGVEFPDITVNVECLQQAVSPLPVTMRAQLEVSPSLARYHGAIIDRWMPVDRNLLTQHYRLTRAEQVELATARWVAWWNRERLHGACGDVPPAEFEAAYWARQEAPIAVA
jgi:transposase InsO family protein